MNSLATRDLLKRIDQLLHLPMHSASNALHISTNESPRDGKMTLLRKPGSRRVYQDI